MASRRNSVRRSATSSAQESAAQPQNLLGPLNTLTEDQVEDIHSRSVTFLETDGLEVQSEKARKILKSAGADVGASGCRVRFDGALLESLIATAPSEFELLARNPKRSLHVGGLSNIFMSVASAPNVSGYGRDRRPGNQEDFRNLVKLCQSLNIVHAFGGYPVEPLDVPANTRHLDCINDTIHLSDKPFRLYAIGAERIRDGLEMARIANGLTEGDLDEKIVAFTNVNINSPLVIDDAMLEGLMETSRRNQAVIITPFTLSGAMAPITIAGALLQQNIEALAGIAMTQAVRPGSPVVYGCFTSNVDMKSGAPAFGTP
ncbi:MAG: trimethylamine methyltransferase family protein, partial [Paracoccaceae bacterium]|nr:trimethylamine methyltransferase family protein [Paracoccaceae bacterium]